MVLMISLETHKPWHGTRRRQHSRQQSEEKKAEPGNKENESNIQSLKLFIEKFHLDSPVRQCYAILALRCSTIVRHLRYISVSTL